MKMLFLVTQDEADGYDTYDSMIVCAESVQEAKTMHPGGDVWKDNQWQFQYTGGLRKGEWSESVCSSWCSHPDNAKATYIGDAEESVKKGIVLASFNAG